MNTYSFSVDGRYIFDFSMANDQVSHRLLDTFGKKDREILNYLTPNRIVSNGHWNCFYPSILQDNSDLLAKKQEDSILSKPHHRTEAPHDAVVLPLICPCRLPFPAPPRPPASAPQPLLLFRAASHGRGLRARGGGRPQAHQAPGLAQRGRAVAAAPAPGDGLGQRPRRGAAAAHAHGAHGLRDRHRPGRCQQPRRA
ncbi:hypothetical protein SORBI_3005G085400 [Sorghum bicolor]|uniref:Uncharacterized protein n=1 Tax=Sorghum bicolor TaxID=4558 RepID=A0A1B6PR12_SORBI|nr:hypothetical protein SORBI_3005G085400 [Sorghum bicolor]